MTARKPWGRRFDKVIFPPWSSMMSRVEAIKVIVDQARSYLKPRCPEQSSVLYPKRDRNYSPPPVFPWLDHGIQSTTRPIVFSKHDYF
jgi:hypothetical protein